MSTTPGKQNNGHQPAVDPTVAAPAGSRHKRRNNVAAPVEILDEPRNDQQRFHEEETVGNEPLSDGSGDTEGFGQAESRRVTNRRSISARPAANELSNQIRATEAAVINHAEAEYQSLALKLNQLLLDFGLLAKIYGLAVISEGGVPRPTEFPEHRKLYSAYRGAELVCYVASVVLLTIQVWLTLALDWWVKISIIATVFLIIWLLFPAIIYTVFDVDQKRKDSIKNVKRTLLVGAVLALMGLFAFAFTRASDETTGIWAMLYANAFTVAEFGFAIAAASAQVMKRFYEWSIRHAQRYETLIDELDAVSARLPDSSNPLHSANPEPEASDV